YEVERSGNAYPLSLKDLCAVQLIPELLEAGIDSFKIEGRMKNAEYCAGVTAVYRAVMDRFFADGKAAQGVTQDELALLRGLYVRSEIGDGYYHCQSGGHMLTQGKPGYRGCEESVLAMLRERCLEQKPVIPVTMSLCMAVGEKARLTVCCDETEVTCEGEIVQAAANKPLTGEELRKRLQKTGGTPFSVEKFTVSMSEAVFMPVGQINELRREALSRMEEALLIRYEREREAGRRQESVKASLCDKTDQTARGQNAEAVRGYLAVVNSAEQLAVCAAHPLLQGICVPVDVYETYRRENGTAHLSKQRKQPEDVRTKAYYLYLPRILRNKDTERLTGKIRALAESGAPIDGIYVHTAGEYRYAADLAEALGKEPQEFLFGSPFLYCMNTESARFWQTRLRALSVPYELCEREVYALLKRAGQAGVSGLEMPVYGHIPTMVTANCIVRSFDRAHCPQPEKQTWLKDRTGQRMYVKTECGVCLNTIYNSVPLSMHKHMPKLQKLYEDQLIGAFTLNFTMESAARTKEILDFYLHPTADAWKPGTYTNGHFQRGVV
ncbi:MAG: U32 family peptidase, partial [Lachnospiraceae bacterium]|nr:U32 family peptidase [Lachnospiraceae bacterium]